MRYAVAVSSHTTKTRTKLSLSTQSGTHCFLVAGTVTTVSPPDKSNASSAHSGWSMVSVVPCSAMATVSGFDGTEALREALRRTGRQQPPAAGGPPIRSSDTSAIVSILSPELHNSDDKATLGQSDLI